VALAGSVVGCLWADGESVCILGALVSCGLIRGVRRRPGSHMSMRYMWCWQRSCWRGIVRWRPRYHQDPDFAAEVLAIACCGKRSTLPTKSFRTPPFLSRPFIHRCLYSFPSPVPRACKLTILSSERQALRQQSALQKMGLAGSSSFRQREWRAQALGLPWSEQAVYAIPNMAQRRCPTRSFACKSFSKFEM
jgi:hypothetical protein